MMRASQMGRGQMIDSAPSLLILGAQIGILIAFFTAQRLQKTRRDDHTYALIVGRATIELNKREGELIDKALMKYKQGEKERIRLAVNQAVKKAISEHKRGEARRIAAAVEFATEPLLTRIKTLEGENKPGN